MGRYKDPDSWSYGGVKRRDFRADHGTPEVPPHRKKAKPKRKPKAGCPENNNNAHVYVRVRESSSTAYNYGDKFVITTDFYNLKKCCGCGKVSDRSWDFEATERMVVDKIPRWYWQF